MGSAEDLAKIAPENASALARIPAFAAAPKWGKPAGEASTQMDLAAHLEMERTTLYRALDVLEKSGLIISRPTRNGVAREVSLTARGKKVTAEAEAAWKELHDGFVGRFGAQRLHDLNALLTEVRNHFRGGST
jgi:DNA-binding MarR family transcriptional regulator